MKKVKTNTPANKIQAMRADGKISEQQARMLEEALNHSEQRQKVFNQQIKHQKFERERQTWGFLGFGFLIILVLLSFLSIMGSRQGAGRDINRSVVQLNEAGLAMGRGDLDQARELTLHAIRKSSRFPLAYTMKGLIAQQQYQKTGKFEYKEEARTALIQAENYSRERNGAKMTGAGFFFLIIFMLFFLCGVLAIFLVLYNNLVRNEEGVNESWAQIGILVQRKLDLIPALVQSVEGYAKHEKTTLQEVTESRTKADQDLSQISGTGASKQEQLDQISHIQQLMNKGLGKIFALVEKYPDLKANESYLTLQDQISQTENQIAKAREKFNKKVRAYNTHMRQFPYNILVSVGKFEAKQYFKTEDK